MSDLEKGLVVVYTAIAIILVICLFLFLIPKEKWKKNPQKKMECKDICKAGALFLLIVPMSCISIFFIFVMSHGIADMLIADDFILEQIITNTFNIYLLYLIIKSFKEKIRK